MKSSPPRCGFSPGFHLPVIAALMLGASLNLYCQENAFYFGFGGGGNNVRDGQIWSVSTTLEKRFVFDTGFNTINGLAVDNTGPDVGMVYFSSNDGVGSSIYSYDPLSGVMTGLASLGVSVVSAGWYD